MAAKRILDLEDVNDPNHTEPTELKYDVKTEFIELGDVSVIPRDLAVQPYSPARQSSLLMSPCSAQSCSPANNKKQEAAENRAKISKKIQEIDQLCPRSRKMQAYDNQRAAKVEHDQVLLRMKSCELNLKLAILEVTEVKSILERRKLLNDSYNEMIIID